MTGDSEPFLSPDPIVEAAERAIASIKYGWLATLSGGGLINARPMSRLASAPGDDPWLIRFVTDARSRKVAEIPVGGEVAVVCQRDVDDCYIALQGEAALRPDASADPRLWRQRYEVYFAGEGARANAAFLEVRIAKMALWMRSVTSEPFGLQATIFERDAAGPWRRAG